MAGILTRDSTSDGFFIAEIMESILLSTKKSDLLGVAIKVSGSFLGPLKLALGNCVLSRDPFPGNYGSFWLISK
jgi:hypothetical protein